jgi:hypothetical protein
MKQQNEQLAQHAPHQERRRAGNYLEAINEFNGSKLKSSLNDSVILVDHPAEDDSQMNEENNQSQSIDQTQIISVSGAVKEDF